MDGVHRHGAVLCPASGGDAVRNGPETRSESGEAKLRRRTLLSVAVLAAAGASGIVVKTVGSRKHRGDASQPEAKVALAIRRLPVAIPPHGELADVVPIEMTRDLLLTLLPCWAQAVKVDNLLHAFRLWGGQADFPEEVFVRPFEDRDVFSGQAMERIFMDSRRFQAVFPEAPPLLLSFADGALTRIGYSAVSGGNSGALIHRDNLLRAFAELGYTSDTPLLTTRGDVKAVDGKVSYAEFARVTIRDLVWGSVAYFDPLQETDWTVEALARYLAPQRTWTNRFGQTFSFDDVARRLLSRPIGHGSCQGLHGLYALICLWRIDQEHNVLSDSVRDKIEGHLQQRSRRLEQNSVALLLRQTNPRRSVVDQDPYYEDRRKWIDTKQLVFIAHHLEWIALAPKSLRPKRDTVRRAVDALLRGLEPWSMYARSGDYGPLTHAGTSLCGLLGRSPMHIAFQTTNK